MRGRRLLWQLYPSYLLITLVSLLAVMWYTSRSIRKSYRANAAADLEARAGFVREQLPLPLPEQSPESIDRLCKRLGRAFSTRVTIVLPDGEVLGDSDEDPRKMDNHANRPEIREARAGRTGSSIRYSHTLRENMMYVAIPVMAGQTVVGVARTSIPLTAFEQTLRGIYMQSAVGALIVALLAAGISLIVSRRISRPLEEMKQGVERFARGEFSHKLPVPDSQEIGALAEEMNAMAEHLRRLETIRQDFVANVSHELRTPVTAIKGFVETLREGALKDPEDASRFLGIIARQVDRLNAIIGDLLTLSRLEEGTDAAEIRFEEHEIRDVLEAAIQVCEMKASAKGIAVDIDCEPDLVCRSNAPLLEQAVVNLIDNAVNHSEDGNPVHVSMTSTDGDIAIAVTDQGCGIKDEHLSRLFERFYRVDKARSRKLGGTGLGLAIVKHIAQVHGGTVEVESTPGKGSTFTLRIPKG